MRVIYIFFLCMGLLWCRPATSATPLELVTHKDVVYAEVNGDELMLDLYLPKTALSPPLVVWIHGGGWRAGSRKNPKLLAVTEHSYALASISYRFTEKSIFPAQIHDCKAAIRWLRAHADKYNYNAKSITVAGSSAGGHLALLLGTSGDVAELEGDVGGNLDHSSRVQAVIDYYGPSDFVLRGKTQPERAYTEKSGSFALLGGIRDGKVSEELQQTASPSHYVTSDDPPLLIFHGDVDKTVLLDQSERIASVYKKAGLDAQLVVLKGAGHGGKKFFANQNYQLANDFLNSHCPLRQ